MKASGWNASLNKVYPYISLVFFFLIATASYAQPTRRTEKKECYQVVNAISASVIKTSFTLDSKVTATHSRKSSIDQSISSDSTFSDIDKAYMEKQAEHAILKRWVGKKIQGATVVPDRKLRNIFLTNTDGWDVIQKKTGRKGFYSFSIPIFSKDRSRSAIYVSNNCGGRCGQGYIFILERKEGEWVVSKINLIWIS